MGMGLGQIVVILCLVAASLSCATRFYLRVIKAKKNQPIEYILILALIFQLLLGYTTLLTFSLLPTGRDPLIAVQIAKLTFVEGFLYLAVLWSVKISINLLHIQLTRGFKHINVWAIRTLYLLIGCVCFIIVTYFLACRPLKKKWAFPSEPQCTPIVYAWDFWTHLSLHMFTDIILCILPFPALLNITERRLRFAVCGVYSLAIISVIISIIRAILLAADGDDSPGKVMTLSMLEVTFSIVLGVLPGISSTFTRKYLNHYSAGSPKQRGSTRTHALANTSIGGHQLESYEQGRNSAACLAMPQKAKQQMGTGTGRGNESQEDILGDGFRKGVLGTTNATASKTGSFRSDHTGVVTASREEF